MANLPQDWKTAKGTVISIKDMVTPHLKNAQELLMRVKWRLEDEIAELMLSDLDEVKSNDYYYLKTLTLNHKSRLSRIESYLKALKQELKTRPEEVSVPKD